MMKKISKHTWFTILFFSSAYFPSQPVSAQHYGPEQKITAAQNFPEAVKPGSDFMMEIKINKGNITGLAKFQQYIPAGMTAAPVSNAGADFSFEAQNVKFIWTSIPQSADITLRYKISVTSSLQGKKYLSGTFSYVENDRTKKTSLVPKEIDITPGAPVAEAAIAGSTPVQEEQPPKAETASSAIPKDEPEPEETKTEASAGNVAPVQTTPEVTETKKPVETVTSETAEPAAPAAAPLSTTTAKSADTKSAEPPINETAPAASGITFKVQIAAMNEKHFRRKNYFQEKFGLQMEVAAEEHDGLKKYTVGNFTTYAQAHKLRDDMLAKAGGSFVVAYKDGVRIPVAEAIEMLRKK